MNTDKIFKAVIAFERADAKLNCLLDLKYELSSWVTDDVLGVIDARIKLVSAKVEDAEQLITVK